jgi:hypothetical protein
MRQYSCLTTPRSCKVEETWTVTIGDDTVRRDINLPTLLSCKAGFIPFASRTKFAAFHYFFATCEREGGPYWRESDITCIHP